MQHITYALTFLAHVQVASMEQSITNAVVLALAQLLEQSKMFRCPTLYIYVQYSEFSSRPALMELLTELLNQLESASQPRIIYEQHAMKYKPYINAVLLLVDDMRALRSVYSRLQGTGNLSYTLVYMLRPEPTQVMKLFWQLSVLNVGLLSSADSEKLLLLSYYPYSKTYGCKVIRASVVNYFQIELKRWAHDVYFPAKLRNFYGCTLTCATWPDMPYLVQRNDGSFVGIEGSLLQFMANNLNFTVGIYWLNGSQVRDTFNESGWIFEQIFNASDYALGGFHYKPNEGCDMPYSQSTYYFMSHIMLVTNLPSAYSAYDKLAFPFHPRLWLAIGLMLAMSCLMIWLIQRCWKPLRRHPYYQLHVVSIGGSLLASELPRRNAWRLLFVTWLMWALVLRSAYQSGMYQLLRQNIQRNPPQTIADVLDQRYTIQLVDGNADRWLASLPELRTQQLHYLKFSELQSFGSLAASSGSNQRLAIITPYEYFGYFRKLHAMSRRLHVVRERIFIQQLSFNVRRHSHLIGVLNRQISDAHAYGFLKHWTREYVSPVDERDESVTRIPAVPYDTLDGLQPDGYTEPTLDLARDKSMMVLSLNELAGLFWLIVWAHLGAVVVFGLELLLYRS